MKILCNVDYLFNKRVPNIRKGAYISEFMDRRSIAVERLNPKYDAWNEEFSRLYPNKDFESQEYTNYIADKQDEVLEKVNRLKVHEGKQHISLRTSREECGDIVGYDDEHGVEMKMILLNLIIEGE